MSAAPYDALLLVSFGGPEAPADVLPFLENVTRGKAIPRERLLEVGEHYFAVGGVSPINTQNAALVAALEAEFATHGLRLPIYWGNRNWHPFLNRALQQMADDGVQRALAVLTSAYSSYSGCRQYREDLAAAAQPLGSRAPHVDRLRHYFNHPSFVETMVANTVDALAALGPVGKQAQLAFVTHSIPTAMNATSGPDGGAYETQHEEVARLVTDGLADVLGRRHEHALVYCSRSGPPNQPWLGPDVNDHLRSLASRGAQSVVLIPIGFVSDHMEVVHDLDSEATSTARRLGLACTRAATVGTHPRFVSGIRQLVLERAAVQRREPVVRASVGRLGPSHDACSAHCCPNPRGVLPALCGDD